MSNDFDKQAWQAEQAAREAMLEKQREKDEKARARRARNAQRKLERLARQLKEREDLTDWEEEFSASVQERLEKYGAAFRDKEKGGAADALSFAQKRVVSSLKQKAKGEKSNNSSFKKSGFKSKKPQFTPRVRQIEDEYSEETAAPVNEPDRPKRPFLRLVSNDKDKT